MGDAEHWIGSLLDERYRVTDVLGSGGMGSAYRAEDTRLENLPVVVKVPHPSLLQDETFAQRFEAEVRSMIRLVHPNVVRVLDVGEHEGVPYAVMQYLGGGTLQTQMEAGLPLEREMLSAALGRVAEALDFMHERGVIHRDVKPENLLMDEQGMVYVADFGIAKALSQKGTGGLTTTGLSPGTPIYMAPEQAMASDVTGAADQYALAVTAFQSLTGLVPFDAETPLAVLVMKEKGLPEPLVQIAPNLAPATAAVLERAMARDPEKRYPSCVAFVEALRGALSEPAAAPRTPTKAATRPSSPEQRTPHRKRARWLVPALAVAAFALAWALWPKDDERPEKQPGQGDEPKLGSLEPDATSLRNHVEFLASLNGRHAWKDRVFASNYIANALTSLSLVPPPGTETMFQEAGTKEDPIRNVLAWFPGSQSGEHVLVGANYDAMGIIDGVVYPGADNNASGVAALLEIARVLQERRARGEVPKRSILFVAWDANRFKRARLGSTAYAEKPVVPLEECVCAISLDQLGRSMDDALPGLLFAVGAENSRIVEAIVDATPEMKGATLTPVGLDLYLGTPDSSSFQAAKVPGLFVTSGTGKDFALPTDTPEKLDYDWLASHAAWSRDLIWGIADSAERPTWRDKRPPRIEEVRAIRRLIERGESGLLRENISQAALTMLQGFKRSLDAMIERGAVTPSERNAIKIAAHMLWYQGNLWRQNRSKKGVDETK